MGAAGIVLLFAAAPGGAAAAVWSVQSAPAPQVPNASLSSVRCLSSTSCMAVGRFTNGAGFQATLAERWNGSSWTRQRTPNPSDALSSELSGIRCPSSTRCVAVGSYENRAFTRVTLAEAWNGTSWSVQPTPNPGGASFSALSGVTCTTTTECIAVGTFFTESPDPTGSSIEQMLAEHWNGSTWTIQVIPMPAGATRARLNGAGCASSNDCTAVGSAGDGLPQPVVARWNGSRWSTELLPSPSGAYFSELHAVTCTSSAACVAVGDYSFAEAGGPMTGHWNGSGWSIQTLANPPGAMGGSLASVSCSAPTTCTAVGASYAPSNPSPDSGGSATLAARWNGTSWTTQSTPNRPDTRFSWLEGVACLSGTACIAVGASLRSG